MNPEIEINAGFPVGDPVFVECEVIVFTPKFRRKPIPYAGQIVRTADGLKYRLVSEQCPAEDGEEIVDFLLVSDRQFEVGAWLYNAAENHFGHVTFDYMIKSLTSRGFKRVEASSGHITTHVPWIPAEYHNDLISAKVGNEPTRVTIKTQMEKVYDPMNRSGGFEPSDPYVYMQVVSIVNRQEEDSKE